MNPRPALLAAAVLLSYPSFTLAQQDSAPVNASAILKELEAIEQKQQKLKTDSRNAILNQIRTAAMNGQAAASFYTEAVEAVQFEGTKGKGAAFTEWKKNNAELLRGRPMQTALVLYLRYAALAMEWKEAENTAVLVPAVMKYLDDLISSAPLLADAPKEAKDLLSQPLGNSPIAKWLRLGEWLPGDKGFEAKPGNINGILEKNVRTALREAKDPAIIQTWDLQMKIEAERITAGRLDHEAAQFNTVARPRLIFQRAKDMATVGQPNRATMEMIGLIREYPEHPDFSSWVTEVRSRIEAAAQPAPATEETAATEAATPRTSPQ